MRKVDWAFNKTASTGLQTAMSAEFTVNEQRVQNNDANDRTSKHQIKTESTKIRLKKNRAL